MSIIRCSSLDTLVACPPSVIGPDGTLRIEHDEEAGEIGKLIHRLMARYIEDGKMDVNGECDRAGLEHDDDIDFLAHQGIRTWEAHRKYFSTPIVERALTPAPITGTDFSIAGTLDVLGAVGATDAVFMDFKTGRHVGHKHQMAGYAFSIWNCIGRPDNSKITCIVAYLRQNIRRVVIYDAAALKEWEHDLAHNVLPRKTTYKPGEQCERCPIFAACPARQAVVSATVGALMLPSNVPADDPTRKMIAKATEILGSITVDNKDQPEVKDLLTELRFRSKLVSSVLEQLHELQRQTVERVGPIPLDDDTELRLRPVETKQIDPLKALRVLRPLMSDAEIAGAMKLSLPQLCNAAAAKRTRGEKKAAREQVKKELENAGALTFSTHFRLEEGKAGDKELDHGDEERTTSIRPK